MLIVTNFERFPETWQAANGMRGNSIPASRPGEFWSKRDSGTVWLVNCDTPLTLQLAARKLVFARAIPLIAADLVLRIPAGSACLSAPLKRFLLSRVDHFIPTEFALTVGLGDRVRAGQSVLAELNQ